MELAILSVNMIMQKAQTSLCWHSCTRTQTKYRRAKVEMRPAAQKKLREFREKLQSHHCKYWQDAKELQYKVAISLIQEINLNPAIGWVRASDASNEELLKGIERSCGKTNG